MRLDERDKVGLDGVVGDGVVGGEAHDAEVCGAEDVVPEEAAVGLAPGEEDEVVGWLGVSMLDLELKENGQKWSDSRPKIPYTVELERSAAFGRGESGAAARAKVSIRNQIRLGTYDSA